ncbi:MAG: hypothetical protein ACRDMV_04885 [Streptosporangiales bacterium]
MTRMSVHPFWDRVDGAFVAAGQVLAFLAVLAIVVGVGVLAGYIVVGVMAR